MDDRAAQSATAKLAKQKVHADVRQFQWENFVVDHVEQRLVTAGGLLARVISRRSVFS